MLDLAIRATDKPVNLADISHRQGISLSYLEQLFAKLRKGDLVASVRGPGGGYQLSRDAHLIYVAQIIDAVNESVDATSCAGVGDCHDGEQCLTHVLWDDLSEQIHHFLQSISLGSLVERQDVREISERQERKREAVIPVRNEPVRNETVVAHKAAARV
jgi:Rrf2 family iron-sulfur cluster assembly transcriptional regulator